MDKQKSIKQPWLSAYDDHVPPSIDYPKITIPELFRESSIQYGDKVLIRYKDSTYTYQQIAACVEKLQSFLQQDGLKKNERVGIVLPNIPQFVIAYYGILAAGGVVVAMNPRYTRHEFQTMIEQSELKRIICLGSHLEIFNDLRLEVGISQIIFTSAKDQLLTSDESTHSMISGEDIPLKKIINKEVSADALKDSGIHAEDAAIFQFSGGTTGNPKPAVGMHKNIISNVYQFGMWCDLEQGNEKILAAIPLYHVYGMVLALNMGVAIGAEIIMIDDPRDIRFILSQIDANKATFYPGVPTMYHAINQFYGSHGKKFDITSIKACISGSFTLHPEIKKEFERITGGKLIEGYGLSEAPTATHCNPLYGKNKSGSIGMPLPDVDAKIVDLESGNREMEIGEIGELIIRGPQVMRGYHNQALETEETIRDGWLYTGDIAKMDHEGYFFLVDRKKSLIKVNGLQVWPNEVEQVVNAHPDVLASGVGGVPDMESGERVICWVVLKSEAEVDGKALKEWCRQSISSYKVPQEFVYVEQLPRTGVGKILRRELISEYIKNAGQ